MTLNYNSTDPEHIKSRQNVVPPSVEEMEKIVNEIEEALYFSLMDKRLRHSLELFQRLIYDYQNKSHFYDVVGGWDGLNRLKNNE